MKAAAEVNHEIGVFFADLHAAQAQSLQAAELNQARRMVAGGIGEGASEIGAVEGLGGIPL